MRDCSKLLDELKCDYKEVYSYIKQKAKTPGYFIGIRDNYLNIYYKCASVAKVGINKNGPVIETHLKYLGKDEPESKRYIKISFDQLKENWKRILKNIHYIQLGKSDSKLTKSSHKKIEKITQQWIVNETNSRQDSDWYYVDLEYEMKNASTLFRFDMIAVTKQKVDGKHKVALVELKVKDGSYKGMDGSKKKGHENAFDSILKKNDELYNCNDVKFGSGIVGHIADYLRFLHNKTNYNTLKQEIIDIIKCHKRLGVLKDIDLSLTVNDLADKPEVHIVSFTKVPNDKEHSNAAVPIKTLKETMYKYLFKEPKNSVKISSGYCLENCINSANINGFNTLREELFTDNNEIHCVQDIKGENFDFYFTFVDATRSDAWNCLPKL